jgi:hypothetical protein
MRGGLRVVTLDRGGLVFADAAQTAKILPDFRPPALPFLAGQALRADLSLTRATLARNGIKPVFSASDMVCVGPGDALGGYLLFHAPSVSDPWSTLSSSSRSGL